MMQESRPAHSLLKKLFDNSANFVTTGGSANAYTATFVPAHVLASDFVGYLRIHATNTGASTLNANGTGAKNLMKIQGAYIVALAPRDLLVGGIYQVIRDQTGDRYLAISASFDGFSADVTVMKNDFHHPVSLNSIDSFGYFCNVNGTLDLSRSATAAGGIWIFQSVGSTSGSLWVTKSAFQNAAPYIPASGRRMSCRVAPVTGASGGNKYWGLSDTADPASGALDSGGAAKGCFFRRATTGNVFAVTKNGAATETTTDLGSAFEGEWDDYEVAPTPTEVNYYKGGVLVATHTTNIPTVGLRSIVSVYQPDPIAVTVYLMLDRIKERIPGRE
ncbi:hypothetical protein [Candidatus Manganitrophus noduliformans]|uniref:Uncharacterized protein n=1 Tax=Candidatus Manganitrophus noduliformans TaxID=2606439 RepID=A0A7X6DMD5_9BACT|nr:hypothetical protein [Candidatus Manganitrophus noduliformans]NKE69897.1 hypothetical protein [Candidatus Manganitrophus noduliformans]